MPTFCGNCGTPFTGTGKFCGTCGSPIADPIQNEVVAPPPSEISIPAVQPSAEEPVQRGGSDYNSINLGTRGKARRPTCLHTADNIRRSLNSLDRRWIRTENRFHHSRSTRVSWTARNGELRVHCISRQAANQCSYRPDEIEAISRKERSLCAGDND